MMRLCGGTVFIVCVMLWGRERAASLYNRQRLTKALASFTAFCGERISSFRDPLNVIFDSFENDILDEFGFISVLREKGIAAAAEMMSPALLKEDAALLTEFSKKIGGENPESQYALCSYVSAALEAGSQKQLEELAVRAKMYRLLPPLAALSAVILLI